MEQEFIKCEVNFRLKDGEIISLHLKRWRLCGAEDSRISPTLWRGIKQSYGGAFHVGVCTA